MAQPGWEPWGQWCSDYGTWWPREAWPSHRWSRLLPRCEQGAASRSSSQLETEAGAAWQVGKVGTVGGLETRYTCVHTKQTTTTDDTGSSRTNTNQVQRKVKVIHDRLSINADEDVSGCKNLCGARDWTVSPTSPSPPAFHPHAHTHARAMIRSDATGNVPLASRSCSWGWATMPVTIKQRSQSHGAPLLSTRPGMDTGTKCTPKERARTWNCNVTEYTFRFPMAYGRQSPREHVGPEFLMSETTSGNAMPPTQSQPTLSSKS